MACGIYEWVARQFYENDPDNDFYMRYKTSCQEEIYGSLPSDAGWCRSDLCRVDFVNSDSQPLKSDEILSKSQSWLNPNEASLIVDHVLKHYSDYVTQKHYTIGVLCMYRAQVEEIKRRLQHSGQYLENVLVNTADSYQGSEKDIIYVSTVRSNLQGRIGFLDDPQRMCVALTRAKQHIYLFGSKATIRASTSTLWNDYLNYAADENGARDEVATSAERRMKLSKDEGL